MAARGVVFSEGLSYASALNMSIDQLIAYIDCTNPEGLLPANQNGERYPIMVYGKYMDNGTRPGKIDYISAAMWASANKPKAAAPIKREQQQQQQQQQQQPAEEPPAKLIEKVVVPSPHPSSPPQERVASPPLPPLAVAKTPEPPQFVPPVIQTPQQQQQPAATAVQQPQPQAPQPLVRQPGPPEHGLAEQQQMDVLGPPEQEYPGPLQEMAGKLRSDLPKMIL